MNKTRRVALAIDLSYPLRHHHGVFAGTQLYARERGNWECVVQPFIRMVRRGSSDAGYDGIIARAPAELVRNAARARIPLVNLWSATSASNSPSVLPDFACCGRLAAEHLLHRGFRQFAFHGFQKHRGSVIAGGSFEATLRRAECAAARLAVPSECDENARSWNTYNAAMRRWIAGWQPPVGVFAIQDVLGRYLANACLHAGLRVPEDVAIIGLGNEPIICMHPEPSLSSFDLNSERAGYEAAALLDRLMDGHDPPRAPILIEPADLIVRRSTDAFVVDDPIMVAALRFIGEHCHAELRVHAIAGHVHVSVRSLERRFHAALGRTMSQEITRLRMERAKRLLVESDALVKNVAYRCGFSDVKHFHKMFRIAEGTSPGEFRSRKRAAGQVASIADPGPKPPRRGPKFTA